MDVQSIQAESEQVNFKRDTLKYSFLVLSVTQFEIPLNNTSILDYEFETINIPHFNTVLFVCAGFYSTKPNGKETDLS